MRLLVFNGVSGEKYHLVGLSFYIYREALLNKVNFYNLVTVL